MSPYRAVSIGVPTPARHGCGTCQDARTSACMTACARIEAAGAGSLAAAIHRRAVRLLIVHSDVARKWIGAVLPAGSVPDVVRDGPRPLVVSVKVRGHRVMAGLSSR